MYISFYIYTRQKRTETVQLWRRYSLSICKFNQYFHFCKLFSQFLSNSIAFFLFFRKIVKTQQGNTFIV